MNIKIVVFSIALYIFPGIVVSAEKSLADQVSEAKENLLQEQTLNTDLKAKLAEKEQTIATLKEHAATLDEEIAAIKEEHGIEEDA